MTQRQEFGGARIGIRPGHGGGRRGPAWLRALFPAFALATLMLILVGATPLVFAAPRNAITVSPASLSITAEVGETKTADVTITTGKPVVIAEPAATNDVRFTDTLDGTCWQTYLSMGLKIPPKTSCTIRVAFSSTTPGTFATTLRVAQCTAWHAGASGALQCDATGGFQDVALSGTASGQADLMVANVDVVGSAATTPFTWTASAINAGDATINVKNVAIDAVYSADSTLGNDTAACGGVVSTDKLLLRPGDGFDVVFICPNPPPPGSTNLIVQIDGPGDVAESDETNNTTAVALPTVDLVVDSIELLGATATARFNYVVRVRNVGSGDFEYGEDQNTAIVRGWFKSNPGFPDTAACFNTLLDTDFVLPAGATFDVPIACPVTPGHGQDYLLAEVDPFGSIPEFDESNNSRTQLLPELNLFVDDVQLHGPNADTAYRFTASIGLTSTLDLPVDLGGLLVVGYYSEDSIFDSEDIPACSLFTPVPSLVSPGTSLPVALECASAPDPADRFVIVRIDVGNPEVVAESDEVFDNTFAAAIPAVDLVVESLRLEPPNIAYAHSWTAVIRNAGYQTVDVSAIDLQGLYSEDAIADLADPPACSALVGTTIAGFGSVEVLVNCSAVPGAAHRYLVAVVDYAEQLAEADESNNELALLVPGSDLRVQEIILFPDVQPGALLYGVEIENLGPEAVDIRQIAVEGWYSVDRELDGSDENAGAIIVSEFPVVLEPGASVTVPLGAPSPGPSINYLIVEIDADNVVPERDESNNVTAIGLKPDLTVSSVTILGATDDATFTWTATIRNDGDVPFVVDDAPFLVGVEVYLSADDTLSIGDQHLVFCRTSISEPGLILNPAESTEVAGGCNGPSPHWGSDYLIVVADSGNSVPETDETNNTGVQQVPIVNLVIDSVVPHEPQLVGFFGYTTTFHLESTIPIDVSGILIVGAYSEDTVLGAGDNPACSWTLASGSIMSPNDSGQISIVCDEEPSGLAWLIVTVDASNTLLESDEGDNVYVRSIGSFG